MEFSLPRFPFILRGDIEFSWHSEKTDVYGVTISSTFRDVVIKLGGKRLWGIPGSPISFYGGGSPGIHFYSAEVKYGETKTSKSKTWIGIHFFGGMEYSSGGPTYFGELGWGKIFPDKGSWTQFMFIVGIRF